MQSYNDIMIQDLLALAVLGSATITVPAAVLGAGAALAVGRKRGPLTKRAAAIVGCVASLAVGCGVLLGLWILRGTMDDAPVLAIVLPAGTLLALPGAVPAAFLARWLHGRFAARRAQDPDAAAAGPDRNVS